MISLAGRDIAHAWGKFVFTGIGLGLLIGVTLTMAGVYRGMVDDAKALLDNSGADLWVVQQDTQGPYAESSSLPDDSYRAILGMAGVARAANVTYLTIQVSALDNHQAREVRAMVVGVTPDGAGHPGTLTLAKIREIAVLKLIGTRNRTIASMIVQQSLALGLIGFVVGKVSATFWAPIFPKYVLLESGDALRGFVAVMVICVLASFLAIRAALKIDPAEAIGG